MTNNNYKEIIQDLKDILNLSFPYCSDGNPKEDSFIAINKKAYNCLSKLEKLSIQKPE